MLSNETTPRFRHLSINETSRYTSTPLYLYNEKDYEEHRDPEKECFMCRQANVYIKPIGMQQERRVAGRHPPPLTRAQIEELSQKKHLTKREARKLLQCYFPEIKNVKYFQLHKYHSCCYDPKHLNLCKNHITALQHEREQHPNYQFHKQKKDEDHYKSYERDGGNQNRVSFVRIKIEPYKGIPTRFLGPTALPESLADMLIKQVNHMENKKKPPSFDSVSQNPLQTYNIRRVGQPYDNGVSHLSEHLANLGSDDDDDDDDDNDNDELNNRLRSKNNSIRGYYGKVMDRSPMRYDKKIQTEQANITNGDLVVEDIDELNNMFVNEQGLSTTTKPSQKIKYKKRTKHPIHTHHKPKLNHWEMMALDQSQQEVCGCRHHVRRLEANQVVYDWCRCKDHQHKELKERRKSLPPLPPPPPPPPTPPPEKPKKIVRRPKRPKIKKKTTDVNATESTTTELALAYDPLTVDYDVIQEVLYYRTSSGRLVKPQIANAFTYDNTTSSTTSNRHKVLPEKPDVVYITPKNQVQSFEGGGKRQRQNRSSSADSHTSSNPGSAPNDQTLIAAEVSSTNNRTNSVIPVHKLPNSFTTKTTEEHYDDGDEYQSDEFTPPKYMPERSTNTPPIQSPTTSMSMQKSSKPTYINKKPTPNFDRESSILANRRWFDQALGDQNLLAVHDGEYGLIAGTSSEQNLSNNELPDNNHIEQEAPVPRNTSNCTIS